MGLAREVGGACAVLQNVIDCGLNAGGFPLQLKRMPQHHGDGKNRAQRIRDSLACNIRCGSVNRLKEARITSLRIDVRARGESQTARDGRTEVREVPTQVTCWKCVPETRTETCTVMVKRSVPYQATRTVCVCVPQQENYTATRMVCRTVQKQVPVTNCCTCCPAPCCCH